MKKSNPTGFSLVALIVLGLAAWLGPVCWKAHQAAKFLSNFEKINAKPPLSADQVVTILGHPSRIDHSETTGVVGDVYHYSTYPINGDLRVIILNGVVFGTAVDAAKKS